MDDRFYKIIKVILNHEGEYSLNKLDPGNWTGGKVNKGQLKGTKYGIASAYYPNLDIENLTQEQAVEIYYKNYYKRLPLDLIDDDLLVCHILDHAVNCGVSASTKLLQKVVGAYPDGIVGPKTKKAIKNRPEDSCLNFQKERAIHYAEIFCKPGSNRPKSHLISWLRRCFIEL